MKLVRQVNLERWLEPASDVPADDLAADFLTGKKPELKTDRNQLSFWRFDPSDASWPDDAVLALTGEMPEDISITWVDEHDVVARDIPIIESPGVTQFSPLAGHHVDLSQLGSQRLSAVTRLLVHAIRTEQHHRAFTRAEVIAVWGRAVRSRRIKLPNLKQKLQTAISQWMLANPEA